MDGHREMSKHEVDVAFVDWRALPDSARAKVVRSARKGRFHPDPHVAKTSVRWAFAMEVRPPPSRRQRIREESGAAGVGLVVAIVVGFLSAVGGSLVAGLLGGGAAASLSEGMFERRTAERLRRMAGAPPR